MSHSRIDELAADIDAWILSGELTFEGEEAGLIPVAGWIPPLALPDDTPPTGHGSCVNDFKTINRRVKEIAKAEDRPSPLLDIEQHPEIEQGF